MSITTRSFDQPDETREFGNARDAYVTLGDSGVGRAVLEPGWRWSNDIRPIVETTSCEMRHLGYLVSGTLHVESDDGTTADVAAGQAFAIAPGHDAWVVGDEAVVMLDWSPRAAEYGLSPAEVAARSAAATS